MFFAAHVQLRQIKSTPVFASYAKRKHRESRSMTESVADGYWLSLPGLLGRAVSNVSDVQVMKM